LRDGGIESFILDQYMSVLEGSASAIPRRLMVRDEDAERAKCGVVSEESPEGRGFSRFHVKRRLS